MASFVLSDLDDENVASGEGKKGPIKRGKSAILALLSLIEGSKERDAKTWGRIFDTVAEFRYSDDPDLSEKDLTVLDVILHSVLPKLTVRRRREFAEFLSRRDEASDILVESLITDELTVAAPVLARCNYVSDELFQKSIDRGETRHRKIIAGRKSLTQETIEALLETRDYAAQEVLLDNKKIILNEKTYLRLMMNFLGDSDREKKILAGPHLTTALTYKTWWEWTPAARQVLLARFPITPEMFGSVLDELVKGRGEGNLASSALNESIELHERIESVRHSGFTLVLDQSNINELVEFMLNGLLMGGRTIKRILTDESGTSLSVFCNAIGLSPGQYEEIYRQLFQGELRWQLFANNLDRSLHIFDAMTCKESASVVALWSFGDIRKSGKKASEIAA